MTLLPRRLLLALAALAPAITCSAALAANPIPTFAALTLPGGTVRGVNTPNGIAALDANGNLNAVASPSSPGVVDTTVFAGNASNVFTRLMSMTGNEWVISGQAVIQNTQPALSYEKGIFYGRVQQNDPSDYTNNYLRDASPFESQCDIGLNNLFGRCWLYDGVVTIPAGSDALAYGIEVGINNYGKDQPNIGTTTSKYGVHPYGGGTYGGTAAVMPEGKWHIGTACIKGVETDWCWWMTDGVSTMAGVDGQGNLTAASEKIAGGKATLGSGQAGLQSGKVVLRGTSTGGNPVRLTMDGNPATAANSLTIGDYFAYAVSIQLVARDASSGSSHVVWTLPAGLLKRVSGAASTTWFGGTPATVNDGGPNTSGYSVNIGADTTLGALSPVFVPPSGLTDQWDVIATIFTTEGQ